MKPWVFLAFFFVMLAYVAGRADPDRSDEYDRRQYNGFGTNNYDRRQYNGFGRNNYDRRQYNGYGRRNGFDSDSHSRQLG
ncbi:UNVERIFIED_CONTAM: hypothetical protein RMT77_016179 [Armadillidium vulgare]